MRRQVASAARGRGEDVTQTARGALACLRAMPGLGHNEQTCGLVELNVALALAVGGPSEGDHLALPEADLRRASCRLRAHFCRRQRRYRDAVAAEAEVVRAPERHRHGRAHIGRSSAVPRSKQAGIIVEAAAMLSRASAHKQHDTDRRVDHARSPRIGSGPTGRTVAAPCPASALLRAAGRSGAARRAPPRALGCEPATSGKIVIVIQRRRKNHVPPPGGYDSGSSCRLICNPSLSRNMVRDFYNP